MGTNYYAEHNHCKCCNRSNKIHIGKSSFGWAFNFRGYDGKYGYIDDDNNQSVTVPESLELKSWSQWKEYLQNLPIVDEYGDRVEYQEFVEMVETYKNPGYDLGEGRVNKDHITEILSDPRYRDIWSEYQNPDEHWHDQLGYSFSSRYFS